MSGNGDTDRVFKIGKDEVVGVGSFTKTLPHNEFGEVCPEAFKKLVEATRGNGGGFADVPLGAGNSAQLTNPQAGLAADQLTHHPAAYSMPPAPAVDSVSTAAEMTELYWMALLRDCPFNQFDSPEVAKAAKEIDSVFRKGIADSSDAGRLTPGVDVPGSATKMSAITPQNVFRLGLPGEEIGPKVSQFFVRPVGFGTQTIDQKQRPYKTDLNFLTDYDSWIYAQRTGKDQNGQAYPKANEFDGSFFERESRYISTMRDLARFVNKDALHQAYFNATLILLSGDAKWTPGNPYGDCGRLQAREAGFGVLGGPHILALVSEVATRALKVVWNQKWQVNLRLRPEAYGGRVHVQVKGVNGKKRAYGLPGFVATTEAAKAVEKRYKSLLLPMAFTPGSPTHPAYGAGHATVAGACVTILKAYFKTFETINGVDCPIAFSSLVERSEPFFPKSPITAYKTGYFKKKDSSETDRCVLEPEIACKLTIEGELNKLAQNVAMGRSMGGVHWRTDNTRSLTLGEAIAAEILAEISVDSNEKPTFEFRTFSRKADGQPRKITVTAGRIYADGKLVDTHSSAL
ncbi:MAG: vanadium-dependent haloperoxidase [Planctomycetaceae bacterium]|nr:vanadium-dependent haloperoxidase [Planctomycetaceae bacterium]